MCQVVNRERGEDRRLSMADLDSLLRLAKVIPPMPFCGARYMIPLFPKDTAISAPQLHTAKIEDKRLAY